MRSLGTTVFLTSLLIAAPPVIAGADTFPIDELMEMVIEETNAEVSAEPEAMEKPSLPLSPVRDSANKTEQPTVILKHEMQELSDVESIKVGARQFAISMDCEFMQIYRAATDTDFTKTLNLIKSRALGLGADYLTVVYHQEGNVQNIANAFLNSTYLLAAQTSTPTIKTVMVVEMYDCEG